MAGKGCSGDSAGSRDHVDHTVRNADLAGQPRQIDRRHRRVFGGLDHDRIAGGQRRGDAPADQQKRKIPREDETAGTPRVADGPRLVSGDGQHVPPLDVLGHVGEVAKRVDEVLHIACGLAEDLAGVE